MNTLILQWMISIMMKWYFSAPNEAKKVWLKVILMKSTPLETSLLRDGCKNSSYSVGILPSFTPFRWRDRFCLVWKLRRLFISSSSAAEVGKHYNEMIEFFQVQKRLYAIEPMLLFHNNRFIWIFIFCLLIQFIKRFCLYILTIKQSY